jgi:hypothetical protein
MLMFQFTSVTLYNIITSKFCIIFHDVTVMLLSLALQTMQELDSKRCRRWRITLRINDFWTL